MAQVISASRVARTSFALASSLPRNCPRTPLGRVSSCSTLSSFEHKVSAASESWLHGRGRPPSGSTSGRVSAGRHPDRASSYGDRQRIMAFYEDLDPLAQFVNSFSVHAATNARSHSHRCSPHCNPHTLCYPVGTSGVSGTHETYTAPALMVQATQGKLICCYN